MDTQPSHTPRKSLTRKQLQDPVALDLLALLQSVTVDGKLLEDEVLLLKQWLDEQKTSMLPGIVYLREVVEEVLADGRVTDEERTWLQKAVETVLPPDERARATVRRREAAADERKQAAAEKQAETERQAELKRLSRPIAGFDFMVAGVHYEDRGSIIKHHVKEGDRVFLVREPVNPYSPNAIAVRLENGYEIGYVPESEAVHLAPLLDNAALQIAEVKKILHGRATPIPVIWGDLFEHDAPVDGATGSSKIPTPRVWSAGSRAPVTPKFGKPGCLVIFGVLGGLAHLL